MSITGDATKALAPPPQATDWADLPRQAWHDIQETTASIWHAWTSLFPAFQFWDPFGAALTLSLLVGLVVWLVKIRPG